MRKANRRRIEAGTRRNPHRLSQVLPIPLDSELMGEDLLPHDLGMHMHAVITSVREEDMKQAIESLYGAAHADEATLRRDYYCRKEGEAARKIARDA